MRFFNKRLPGLFLILAFLFSFPLEVLGQNPLEKSYTLQDLLPIAREKNPTVEIFQTHVQAALGETLSARAYPNPEVEVLIGKGKLLEGTSTGYESQYGLALSQTLEWPDKRLYRQKKREAQVEATRAELADWELQLTAQVKEAFFQVLLYQDIKEILEKSVNNLQQLNEITRLRVESGEAPELELIRAQVELLKGKKDLRKRVQQIITLKAGLNALLGGSLDPSYQVTGEFSGTATRYDLASLAEKALLDHPAIRRQQKSLEAASYSLLKEKAGQIPDISLRGSFSEEIDKRSYWGGLALVVPLFYRQKGEITVAQAEESRAALELRRSQQELLKQLTQEFQNYQTSRDQMEMFNGGLLKQSEEALRVARLSYEEGETDLLNLLDAQRIEQTTLIEYRQAQFELEAALAHLEQVTGGLR
ncbi:MAG: TolC family protein [Nitrospirae bacterium]|nr:TolC family protein [Nitrospirota bacterium]